MKLTEIYRQIITEEDKPKQYPSGRKQITIICNDSEGELEKFLNWWKTMGDIGHSSLIHCDVDGGKESLVKVYCDGDGADRTESIVVKMLSDEE